MELVGTVIEGRYEILEQVGGGGWGAVYRAYHRGLQQEVAIKIPHQAAAGDDEATARFLNEIKVVTRLRHPAIVAVFDAGRLGQRPYLVMEYISGGSLADLLRSQGPLPPHEVASLLIPVASALDYAHSQAIVHRDVKPGNMLIDAEGRPRLSDFGLVKQVAHSLSSPGQALGTPWYMAPEQVEGVRIGPAADIYALGVVAYELLTGQVPFQGSATEVCVGHLHRPPRSLLELRPGLPLALDKIVLKALSKKPEERYISATAFATTLEQAARQSNSRVASPAGPVDYTGQAIGRYLVEKRLGGGGMAVVYKAEDATLSRPVAIKVPRPELLSDPDFVRRFSFEARGLAQLAHPNIVTVYEASQVGETPYIAMQYVNGGSLASHIGEPGALPLTPAEAALVVGQVAAGLDYAHDQGMVHRDIKPENILVDEARRFKITDFGLVKIASISLSRDMGRNAGGTPAYMAPEQILGKPVGPWTDIYALGVMTYLLLTGEKPFRGTSIADYCQAHLTQAPPPLRSLNPTIPEAVEQVVLKALEKDPQARYTSAGLFAAALDEAASGPRHTPAPQPEPQQPEPRQQRRPGPATARAPIPRAWIAAGLGALTVLVLLIGGALLLVTQAREREQTRALLDQGAAAIAQGQLATAVGFYEQARERDPDSVLAHAQLAFLYSYTNRIEDAIAASLAAVEADPSSAMAHARLAGSLSADYQLELALAEARKAVELDPTLSETHGTLATVLGRIAYETYNTELLEEAIASAERALETAGDEDDFARAFAENARGIVYWREYLLTTDPATIRTAIAGGTQHMNRAGSLQSQLALFKTNLAFFYLFLGERDREINRPEEAEKNFAAARQRYDEALTTDASYAAAQAGIGWVHYNRKEYDEAIAAFKRSIELDPRESEGYFGLNSVYRAQDPPNFELALEQIDRAIKIERNNPRIYTTLGWTYYERWLDLPPGDEQEAADLQLAWDNFDQGRKILPGSVQALSGLGWMRYASLRYSQAAVEFQGVLGAAPTYPDALYGMAAVYEQQEDLAEAERFYKKTLAVNPSHVNAMRDFAAMLEDQGRAEEADRYFADAERLTIHEPFGPLSGELAHNDDGSVELTTRSPRLRDFSAEATFTNPYEATDEQLWDYGFFFRRTSDANYRIFVRANGEWVLELWRNDEDTQQFQLASSTSGSLGDALRLGAGLQNTLRIEVRDASLTLIVNGQSFPITDASLGEHRRWGTVQAATGFYGGSERPGATTRYENFRVDPSKE